MPSDIQGRAHTQSAFSTALYAILLVVLALRFVYGLYDYDPLGVLAAAGALVVVSALCLWGTRAARSPGLMRFILVLQPMLSIVGVTAIVHYSGGPHSNFIFLYSIPALTAMWVSATFAVCIAAGATLALGALLWGGLSDAIPMVAKVGYEGSQLVAIHVSRLILLMTVVLGASFAYISYLARRNRSRADLREETVYLMAQELAEPLAETRTLLASLASSGPYAAHATELTQRIDGALAGAQDILARLDTHTPLAQRRNLALGTRCSACSSAIGVGATYWAMSSGADTAELGAYRNDIHCNDCHTGTACDICAAYTQSPAISPSAPF